MPASLIALLDDIASVLDDVALMTKTAAAKTAGVLGDDLALNAEQVAGMAADRELPVVWAVAKGSAINKAILVPAALAISALAPWGIAPLLMIGGVFLCFEGCEKLAHAWRHRGEPQAHAVLPADVDLVAFEKDKIRGAIRTDFVLSAEIVTISLGSVAGAPILTQFGVLVAVAAMMTVGVYGVVAGIVKLDDLGLHLARPRRAAGTRAIGRGILVVAPYLMKTLSVVGLAAVFLVGGGILVHSVPALHEWLPRSEGIVGGASTLLVNAVVGLVAGMAALLAVTAVQRLRGRRSSA